MDGHTFDLLAGRVADRFSRRHSLKLALGGIALGSAVTSTRQTALARSAQGTDAPTTELFDLSWGLHYLLPYLEDTPLAHFGGTVSLTPQAFTQQGALAERMAPLFFDEADAQQVRYDVFAAPDGSHNVYLYQILTPNAASAGTLFNLLGEQFAVAGAEDVTKNLGGWNENSSVRYSVENLSRIQSFNALDSLVTVIFDDQVGTKKNTVTLHRNILGGLADAYSGGLLTAGDLDQIDPPGLPGENLIGLMPLVDGIDQFSLIVTATDGRVVPRYNIDSTLTEETLGGAINATNGSYFLQGDDTAYSVYCGFREHFGSDLGQEYLAKFLEIHRNNDSRNRIRRQIDEGYEEVIADLGDEAKAYRMFWNPAENVRLIGGAIVVRVDTLVFDMAIFTPFTGGPAAFDAIDFDNLDNPVDLDFANYTGLIESAIDLVGTEPTVEERYRDAWHWKLLTRPVPEGI